MDMDMGTGMNTNNTNADELERLARIDKMVRDLLSEIGQMRARVMATDSERIGIHAGQLPAAATARTHTHAGTHTAVLCRTTTTTTVRTAGDLRQIRQEKSDK